MNKTYIFEVRTIGVMIGNYDTLCRACNEWGVLNVIVIRVY